PADPLPRTLAADGPKPVAVVLTHGHLDHTFSVLPVCDGYDIPAYLHPSDFGMLSDPGRWHGPALAPRRGRVARPGARPADQRRAAARPVGRAPAGRRRGALAGRRRPDRAAR